MSSLFYWNHHIQKFIIYQKGGTLFMPAVNRIPPRNVVNQFQDTELEAGRVNASNDWEVIVKYNGDILKIADELQIEIEILGSGYAIATLSLDKIPLLIRYPEIEHLEPPKTLTSNLKEELSHSCVTNVESFEDTDISGEGTIIAILDSGIDYTHPDFINEDGTSRILYLWDQTISGNSPQGFTGGAEYTNSQINEALKSSNPYQIVPETDSAGHGTAVAGAAAGNGRASGGENAGVAPKASLIVVKLGEKGYPSFALTTELMRAIKYCIDKALELKMPLAINISYGTNDGPHNGQSIFETYINSMAEKWKTSIIVASGNEGGAAHHYSGKISSGETQDVKFFYAGKYPSFYITLWKNFVDNFTVELILPNGQTTGEIINYDLTRTYRIGDTSILINYGQPRFYNAFQEIFFQINSLSGTPLNGVFTIKIKASKIVDGNYNIYLPTIEEVSEETAFTTPCNDVTLTIPSTAQNVITVGGYDSTRNTPATFSGRGNTLNIIFSKPDLVAPAVNVLTTAVGGGYSSFTGTSIAAPFVTGAVAMMMQWGIVQGNDPFLYGERVKAYLKSGARRASSITYPNNRWGYGSLCLLDTLGQLRAFSGYV